MVTNEKLNKGITLVALVITIVILLILAGISIQAITNTGLFANAKKAKEKSMEGQLKEEISLAIQDIEVEEISKGNGVTLETLAGGQLENKLKDINSIDNYYIQFRGFDFNSSTEFKLTLYAQFFIEKLNRFQEIVEDSDFNTFNSHTPMRGTYIKFLENYNDLKSTNNYQFGNLSYEMISKVLSL